MLKKLLFLFSFGKTETKIQGEIDAIIAPIAKIVAKLDKFVDARTAEIETAKSEVARLDEKIKSNDIAISRAVTLGSRYRKLAGVDADAGSAIPAE